MAEALYRKYRPQIFEDVVGQEHIERTLKNAIEQDKVSHAYLFTGPRGTGKTTTARLLAKALLCERGPTAEPDGTCDDCRMIANVEHPDVYELDAASRTGVENVREEIIGRVQFAPTRGRYKVYIIDEVHMLSTAAFNALLKTLEEPPSHVVFILATTDPRKVPETIHSRCQRFDFRRIPAETIVSRLGAICMSEGVEFEGEALDLIAHRAEGGMRNALTSLEQLIAFGEGAVTLEAAERMLGGVDSNDLADIVCAIGARDVARCFRWTADFVETGADLAQFTRDLAEHIRNLYVMSLTGADVALEINDTQRRELVNELPLFGPDRLARLLGVLGDLTAELKTSTNLRLSFELALTRMVRPDSDFTLEALAERIEALESGYSAVAHVPSAPAPLPNVPETSPVPPALSTAHEEAKHQLLESAARKAYDFAPVEAYVPDRASKPLPQLGHTSALADRGVQPAASAAVQPAEPGLSAQPATATQPATAAAAQPVAATQHAATVAAPSASATAAAAPSAPNLSPAVQAAPKAGSSQRLKGNLQNPAALQRVWKTVLTALKKNKAAYGVLFLNTKVVYNAEKHMLIIEFPAENTFAFKAVQKPDIQDALTAALLQACGEELPFAYVKANATEAQSSSSAKSTPKAYTVESGISAARNTTASAKGEASAFQTVSSPHQQTSPAVYTPQPKPAQPSSPATPFYDNEQVPYDDEQVPYDDEQVPYDDEQVPFNNTQAPYDDLKGLASSPKPSGDKPADLPQVASHKPQAAPNIPSVLPDQGDLQAILAAGFGEGVIVEEIKE